MGGEWAWTWHRCHVTSSLIPRLSTDTIMWVGPGQGLGDVSRTYHANNPPISLTWDHCPDTSISPGKGFAG
jgi:hypothetical protein